MTAGEGRREKSSIPQTVVLICTRTVHISYLSPAEECEIVWAAWLTQSGPQFSQVLHFRNILNSILKADGFCLEEKAVSEPSYRTQPLQGHGMFNRGHELTGKAIAELELWVEVR